jgi:hypothetical protein
VKPALTWIGISCWAGGCDVQNRCNCRADRSTSVSEPDDSNIRRPGEATPQNFIALCRKRLWDRLRNEPPLLVKASHAAPPASADTTLLLRKSGDYHEMQRVAREFTPRATEILRDIANDPSEDSRNRIVAIGMLYDRAWGKPKEYDPAEDKEEIRPRFDPSLYTPEQLTQIEATLRMVAAAQQAETEAQATGEPASKRPVTDAFAQYRGRSSTPPSTHERIWSR